LSRRRSPLKLNSPVAELPWFFFIDKTYLAAYTPKSCNYRCHAEWLTQEDDDYGNRAMEVRSQCSEHPKYHGQQYADLVKIIRSHYSGGLVDVLELKQNTSPTIPHLQ